jgi:hypothetical protein
MEVRDDADEKYKIDSNGSKASVIVNLCWNKTKHSQTLTFAQVVNIGEYPNKTNFNFAFITNVTTRHVI